MDVWCLFRKLESYYDDNDKTLLSIRETHESCEEIIKNQYPYYNREDFVIEKWTVRK